MLKIIGGACVILSAFLLGLRLKKDMKDAYVFTDNLISGLDALKEEIRYKADYLENSMMKASDVSGTAKLFFDKVYSGMTNGEAAEEAWNNSLSAISSSEVRVLIAETGKQIGKTDTESQIKLLENCTERLKSLYLKQKNRCEKHGDIYPKFGAVAGIFITILLI